MKTFKILGLLLTYPVPETIQHWPAMSALLEEEQLLGKKALKHIQQWMSDTHAKDIYALQESYVETFDRGRGHCLHLFEHIHGESRERGQAMVDLAEMYATKGLSIQHSELPDYLPLFLEYCSLCDFNEAQSLLSEVSHILVSIGTKLKKRDNSYHVIFETLQYLSKARVDQKVIDEAIAFVEAEDNSLEALDKEWEEAEAFSGDPQESDCASCVPETALATSLDNGSEQAIKIVGGIQ